MQSGAVWSIRVWAFNQATDIWIPSSVPTHCVTLGKLFNLSYLAFLIFKMGLTKVPTSKNCSVD